MRQCAIKDTEVDLGVPRRLEKRTSASDDVGVGCEIPHWTFIIRV